MNTGKTLFAQLMDFLPWTTFARFVIGYMQGAIKAEQVKSGAVQIV